MSKVIVQPLIESLSEFVAQLAQIIIANKAHNKAPPQNLPLCVAGVQKAAGTLVQVAKQLAQDEYEDFPQIQDEIVVSATDVENAARQLNEATISLVQGAAGDRAGAWDSLGEAVRVMAQETSILLHIVYGAEIKKIFALSNYADGKLKDLQSALLCDMAECNPQLFVNKVQAAMEDVQKLAQGLRQKAEEEQDDAFARKELSEAATALEARVEPFVATANELLQQPKDAQAKQAVQQELADLINAADKVSAPKPKTPAFANAVVEINDCVNKMDLIEPTSAEGQKQAQRLLSTLDAVTRANRLEGLGPATALMNGIVDLSKDLDQIESLLKNPGVAPLGSVDPLDATEPHAQQVLGYFKKLTPDPDGARDNALSDAERLNAIITNDLLPLARKARSMEEGAARSQAIQAPLAALEQARQQLDAVTKDMDLTAAQSAQVKAAQKTNTVCIKLGAMVGSKKQNKQDVFTAAKNLTDLLGEMNALLGLTQGAADATTADAKGALLSAMDIAGTGTKPEDSVPKPLPKPGAEKKVAAKAAAPAVEYKTPAQRQLVSPDRGSVGAGFTALGAGAEELKTIAIPKAQKGADLLPESDPVIQGVRGLGEQLALLAHAATTGNNEQLLSAGRSIHEQMKAYSALLKRKAASCKDAKTAHELITLSNQLQNWSVQLKILTSVKASSGGGRDSDKALISMTQQIQNGLRSAPGAVLKALLAM